MSRHCPATCGWCKEEFFYPEENHQIPSETKSNKTKIDVKDEPQHFSINTTTPIFLASQYGPQKNSNMNIPVVTTGIQTTAPLFFTTAQPTGMPALFRLITVLIFDEWK